MTDIDSLKAKAADLRANIVKMIHAARSGHPGGSLSAADIVTALYYSEMRIRPEEPAWPLRDRFILSKGHACPVLYSVLAMKGYFPMEELATLREINSRLQGHPDMRKTPGVDSTAGSLGTGLSIGIGMALMAKLDGMDYRTYVMLGCGEMNEGLIWEAAMSAAKFRLDNLLAVVDYNRLQLDGTNDQVMPIEPLSDKWLAFNWNVISIDGHDFPQILNAFLAARNVRNKPTVVIANTVKGKGVSFMEDQLHWHGKAPNDQELATALDQIARYERSGSHQKKPAFARELNSGQWPNTKI